MKEISLHLLDIVQNSISARPSLIKLSVLEYLSKNRLTVIIEDNGRGMNKDFLQKVTSPFITTRTTRKVGLGISLLKASAQRCGGKFIIESEKGIGTKVEASFQYDHIDRPPLGDMGGTIISIVLSLGKDIELVYLHKYNDGVFILDTKELKEILGSEIPLSQGEVLQWIKGYVEEGIKNLYGGVE